MGIEVSLGKPVYHKRADNGLQSVNLDEKYDSRIGKGRRSVSEWKKLEGRDSIIANGYNFSKANSLLLGMNEYVSFDHDNIQPLYIIQFKTVMKK